MPRLIATKEVKYAGVVRKVGDTFDAGDEDARKLIGWGKAANATGQAPAYSNKAESSEGLFNGADESPAKSKRQYRRRDMVSES